MRKSDTHTVYHQTAELECFGRRRVVTAIDGGPMTSDAGARLLPQVDRTLSPFDQVAACFSHRRNPDRIQRALRTRIAQRIVGVALGHEYLNDHDQLRHRSTDGAVLADPKMLGSAAPGRSRGDLWFPQLIEKE